MVFFSRECVTLIGRKYQVDDNIWSVQSRVGQPQQLTGTPGLHTLKVASTILEFGVWLQEELCCPFLFTLSPFTFRYNSSQNLEFLSQDPAAAWPCVCCKCGNSTKQQISQSHCQATSGFSVVIHIAL